MTVVFSVTKNYYKYLLPALNNLYRCNNVEKCYIFIEDDQLNLPFDNIVYINMHKIDLLTDGPNYNTLFSVASLCRLYLPEILSEDKILYLDVDTLVVKNLDELWNTDISEYYVAGVVDQNIGITAPHYVNIFDISKYINSGVLLMNLQKIRDDKMDKTLIQTLNTTQFFFPDQDIINSVFAENILLLPNKFNSSLCTGIASNFCIYHWTGKKSNWVYNREFHEIWEESERNLLEQLARPITT